MRLLAESSVADLADKRLFTGVDLQVLLEVEPLRVDEEAADRAALVVGPVVVHVHVEVVEVGQHAGALDAVDRPEVVLDLILVLAHRRVCRRLASVAGGVALVACRRGNRRLDSHRCLREVVEGQP